MANMANPVGDYNPNPYAVNQYQLPDGRVVTLTNQQYQQIFGNQGNQNANLMTNTSAAPTFPPQSAAVQTQQVEPVRVNGRVVNSHDEIVPSEVPMNGQVSIFPTHDYTCIFAKKWDANGNMVTVKYVPAVEASQSAENVPAVNNDILQELMDKVNNIQNVVTQIQKQRSNNYKKPYNKNQHQKKES